jgi:hopanoid-associated phosphorylase
VALVGLAFEARIAEGDGVLVVCRGSASAVQGAVTRAIQHGCRSIISFGLAGGLAPHLCPGDIVVASSILDAEATRMTNRDWSRKLLEALPASHHGPIVGVNAPIGDPRAKRELFTTTGAVAVDMESHLVARVAALHGLAFAAIRVIVDPAHRSVPEAALLAMRPDGNTELRPMLREIMLRPQQFWELFRIALDAYVARATLLKVRETVGPRFGLCDAVSAVDVSLPVANWRSRRRLKPKWKHYVSTAQAFQSRRHDF